MEDGGVPRGAVPRAGAVFTGGPAFSGLVLLRQIVADADQSSNNSATPQAFNIECLDISYAGEARRPDWTDYSRSLSAFCVKLTLAAQASRTVQKCDILGYARLRNASSLCTLDVLSMIGIRRLHDALTEWIDGLQLHRTSCLATGSMR